MPSAIPYQRLAIEPFVRFRGDADETLHVISIQRSLGGASVDTCTLMRDLHPPGTDQQSIQDFLLDFGQDSDIEVFVLIEGEEFVIFWGKLKAATIDIGPSGEFLRFEARLDHYLIAESTTNTHIRGGAVEYSVHEPLVFNPLIDGVVWENRTPTASETVAGQPYLVVDPESARTGQACEYQFGDSGIIPYLWNMSEAVHYLCWMHNPDETWVKNPTLEECNEILDTDRELLQNVAIPFGVTLPVALDRLLQPYGYDHWIGFDGNDRKLRFLKKGQGRQKTVGLQVLGDTYDPEQTNTPKFVLSFDLSQIVNVIIIHGGYLEMEGTFELHRAWPEEDDTLTEEDLDVERGEEYAAHTRTWRDWVLNEANDYTGTRPEIGEFPDIGLEQAESATPGDFMPEFVNAFLPKRRRFLPAITKDADNTPIGNGRGIEVEWLDVTDTTSDGATSEGLWRPVSWPFEVLENECGIRFNGELPVEMMDDEHRDGLKLRVTASIRGDNRVTVERDARNASVNTDRVEQSLLLDDRFPVRGRFTTGDVASKYVFEDNEASFADPREDMETLADKLIETWNAAQVGGPITLEGIDRLQYELGDIVLAVAGREISLAGTPGNAYPHVAALDINVPDQTVTLHLQSFRQEVVDNA